MKIIFWNIKKKDLSNELDDLVKAEFPEFLILCECSIHPSLLLLKFNTPKTLYSFINTRTPNISVFTSFSDRFVKVEEDGGRHVILRISLPLKQEILLVPLHLPDKGHWNELSQKYECISISSSICDVEQKRGISETIVVGDFNMNPFEEGMISTLGFHAVRDKNIAFKKRRKVQGQYFKFFFNPMWEFYSTVLTPPGTYYYYSSEHVCHFWNLFDQFIFRPELITKFNYSDFRILTKFKHHQLTRGNGLISESYSDHLPIKASFNI